MMNPQRMCHALCNFGLQIVVCVCVLALITSSAVGATPSKHFFWAPNHPATPNPNSLASDLIYHGGNAGAGAIGVETKPAIYLIFWGPDWANGFTTTDVNGTQYTSQQLQKYVYCV